MTPITRFSFSLCSSKQPLGLRAEMGTSGQLALEPLPPMDRGNVVTVTHLSLREFAALRAGLRPFQAIAYGLTGHKGAKVLPECEHNQDSPLARALPRTIVGLNAKYFKFANAPGVWLIEQEPTVGSGRCTATEFVDALRAAMPELRTASILCTSCNGSYIYRGDQAILGLRGSKAYVVVSDAARIPEIGGLLVDRLLNSGRGRVPAIGPEGNLPLSIDCSVWTPDRLDCSFATCGDGLEQHPMQWAIFEPSDAPSTSTEFMLDTSLLLPPSKAAGVQARQGSAAATQFAAEPAVESFLSKEAASRPIHEPSPDIHTPATPEALKIEVTLGSDAGVEVQTIEADLAPSTELSTMVMNPCECRDEPTLEIHDASRPGVDSEPSVQVEFLTTPAAVETGPTAAFNASLLDPLGKADKGRATDLPILAQAAAQSASAPILNGEEGLAPDPSIETKPSMTTAVGENGSSPIYDMITILHSDGPLMAKRWTKDGIKAYDNAWQFRVERAKVDGILELHAMLSGLAQKSTSCVIRGQFIGYELALTIASQAAAERSRAGKPGALKSGCVPRLGTIFKDQPLHALMFDIDAYTPQTADPVLEPEKAALEFISMHLPDCFHGYPFVWSLSGSAGAVDKRHTLKMHIWFWLRDAYTSAELRAWARTVKGIDPSPYSPVQLHYTASPVFDSGVADPVPVRTGLFEGRFYDTLDDAVPLVIAPALRADARSQRTARKAMADPRDKPGLIGAFCRAYEPSDLLDLLPNDFGPGRDDRHYCWLDHDTGNGVFITDDRQHLVNVHASSPTERACNMFDFVRLHLFHDRDQHIADDVRMGKTPSYKAMSDWVAENHPHVLEDADGLASAEEDFAMIDDGTGPIYETSPMAASAHPSAPQPSSQTAALSVAPSGKVQKEKAEPRFKLQRPSEFAAGARAAWHIREVIPQGELVVLFGDSGSGKSFLALDMTMAIASGQPWRDQRVRQGRVVYVVAEGRAGFRKRLDAFAQENSVDLDSLQFRIVPDCPHILGGEEHDLGIAIEAGGGADIIVVDTFAQTLAGADENSSKDIGTALAALKLLHQATGATILLVHHSGKDSSRGARGWSGLKAAADAELEVSRTGAFRLLKVTKQKDAETGTTFPFSLKVVNLGVDEDFVEITSCVVRPESFRDSDISDDPVEDLDLSGKWQKAIIRELKSDGGSVPRHILIERVVSTQPTPTGGRDTRGQHATRALDSMVQAGRCREASSGVVLPSPAA